MPLIPKAKFFNFLTIQTPLIPKFYGPPLLLLRREPSGGHEFVLRTKMSKPLILFILCFIYLFYCKIFVFHIPQHQTILFIFYKISFQ